MRLLPAAALVLAMLAIAGSAYVRLAPSDPALWHVDPATGQDGRGSATAGVATPLFYAATTPADLLARLDAIALETPRTVRLAGSVEEGRITYITRSALWGFPDYTTVAALPAGEGGAQLMIFARLRFGDSDLGVNAARVAGWLAALGPTVAGLVLPDASAPDTDDA
jgi:uncharacterized protein (DUF1499 family)